MYLSYPSALFIDAKLPSYDIQDSERQFVDDISASTRLL